jgi:hypothetical protein
VSECCLFPRLCRAILTTCHDTRGRQNGALLGSLSRAAAMIRVVTASAADLPSQRGETWNDTEAINRHRAMTPSQRVALAIEASRAALRFAEAPRVSDDRADVRA